MRVCDVCRDLNKPVLELRLALLKPDPDSNRTRPEPIRVKQIEVCEACVSTIWDAIQIALTAYNKEK